jgi:membrane-associated phospholipid phosphatase
MTGTSDHQLPSEVDKLLTLWQPVVSFRNLFIFLVCYSLLFLYVDRPVAEFFRVHSLSFFLNFFNLAGKGIIYIAVFFMLALYFWVVAKSERWARRMAGMSAWVATAYASCAVLKVLCGRARPVLWFTEKKFGFFGFHFANEYWSFPSGHTTTFISVALGLSIFFPKYWKVFLLIGVLFSLTRVILTEHYLSDVLATSVLMFILLVGVMSWLRTITAWKKIF